MKTIFRTSIILTLSFLLFGIAIATNQNNNNGTGNQNQQPPVNCVKWYDGCNTCEVVSGTITACTEMACQTYAEPKCLAYQAEATLQNTINQIKTKVLQQNSDTEATNTSEQTQQQTQTQQQNEGDNTENQNQNQGDDNQNQNSEQEVTSTQSQSGAGSEMAQQKRSQVATAVQEMLQVADRNGGIGQQVRVIAQTQTQNQEQVETSLQKIQSRSGFAKFFVGPNYGEINNAQEILDQNHAQIAQLNQIKNQLTNQADQETLTEQIQLLEQANLEIETSLGTEQKGFSLFGWMFKAFAK